MLGNFVLDKCKEQLQQRSLWQFANRRGQSVLRLVFIVMTSAHIFHHGKLGFFLASADIANTYDCAQHARVIEAF